MSDDQQFPFLQYYLRLLNLASAVMGMPGMNGFGVNERALFEEILLSWARHQPMSVSEVIDLKALGSPATLHKRLTRLRELDMVCAQVDEQDRRTKWLVPTQKGLQYANSLGKTFSSGT